MKSAKFPLRVLLVAGRHEQGIAVQEALTSAGHKIAGSIGPEEDLAATAQRIQPDAIVIEVEMVMRDLVRGLRKAYERRPVPIVVFTDRSHDDEIRAAIRAGVSSFVVDGLRPSRVVPVMEAAVARFLEFQTLRSERDEAIAKLNERRAIERAKGILMRRRDLPEEAAYEVLRKMAMNRGRRMIEVAESIITAEEALAQN